MRLSIRFHKVYFALAVLLFVVETLIALFVRDSFVRPYLGDVLVVILMYCFIKSFLDVPVLWLSVGVLALSFTIEFLQYVNIVEKLGLEQSNLARTILGTSFLWMDLLAYVAGAVVIVAVEKNWLKKRR